MKLSPADLLHLYENTSTKVERAEFLCAQGVCFGDVPATMNYALATVARERARYRWGLDKRWGINKEVVGLGNEIQLPSLRLVRGNLSLLEGAEEEDVPDEDMVFGVVELKGRAALKSLEDVIGGDSVETGEWESMRALYEGISGVRQEMEDED